MTARSWSRLDRTSKPEPSANERQAIFERLLKRNWIRRELGLPRLQVHEIYYRKTGRRRDR